MANKKINDLTLATGSLLDTMQLETDIGGVTANRITLLQLKSYVHIGTAVISVTGDIVDNTDPANPIINQSALGAFAQTALKVKGASANSLTFKPNETLSSSRILNIIVNDADRTINIAGNITTTGALTYVGAFTNTITLTGNTAITLPTSGTLATLAGAEAFANKTITASTVSGLTITTTTGTLTIASGKTLTVSNILTFTGTDSSSVAFGAGGTVVYTTTSPTFATITTSGAAISQKPVAANSSTAYTIDQANGAQFDITLNSATPVLTLQTVTSSQYQELAVTLIQDGTGGRLPTWSNVTWASGVAPTVSTAIAARTYLKFISDGTTWTGYAVPQSTGSGAVVLASSPTITTPTVSGNITQSSAGGTLVLKQGSNGKCGTFVANGTTPVVISNTSIAITDTIIISLNTIGGTVGVQPHVSAITANTSFAVTCTATDTSTYNYAIISNAA